MQEYRDMSWKELQDKYDKSLETLQVSINSIKDASSEIKKIYYHVIEKSKNDPIETKKAFVNLWLEQINIEDTESFAAIKNDYETFLDGPKPAMSDFEKFEASLDHKLYLKSIGFLESYYNSMNEFFNAWKIMWSNKN